MIYWSFLIMFQMNQQLTENWDQTLDTKCNPSNDIEREQRIIFFTPKNNILFHVHSNKLHVSSVH